MMFAAAFRDSRLGFPARRLRTARRARCSRASTVSLHLKRIEIVVIVLVRLRERTP